MRCKIKDKNYMDTTYAFSTTMYKPLGALFMMKASEMALKTATEQRDATRELLGPGGDDNKPVFLGQFECSHSGKYVKLKSLVFDLSKDDNDAGDSDGTTDSK